MLKSKAGGKREGAGAKKKYNEITKTISFRCPVSKVAELNILVKNKLDEFKTLSSRSR